MTPRLHATAQRSRVALTIDPFDIAPMKGYRVAFHDGLNVWHVTPAPDGTLLVVTEHNGLPVSMLTIDEPFEALTSESVCVLAQLWKRLLDRNAELAAKR